MVAHYHFTFVLVAGLTKALQLDENGRPTQFTLLQKWLPQSHCHTFEPFAQREPSVDGDILEQQGKKLLEVILECPNCNRVQSAKEAGSNAPYIEDAIVFFGHDLGGSVIKKALILAREIPACRRIAEASLAIFFFAGLHNAVKKEGWQRHLQNLLSLSQKNDQNVFMNIQNLSFALSALSENFTNISGSYFMFNVFEKTLSDQEPKSTIKFFFKFISKTVSEHDLPFSDSRKTIPKHAATQPGIAPSFKSGRSHADLIELREEDLVTEWVHQQLLSLTQEGSSWEIEYRKFLCHLTRANPTLHRLETRISSPGSLGWITELTSYESWLATSGISFLHVYGPPGSGVTVLTSNLVWIVGERSEKGICYLNYSFDGQDPMASSELTMIMSLLRQLLSKRPRLFRHTSQLCSFIMQKHCVNVESLWNLFKCLLSKISTEMVLLTIHKVQECAPPCGDIAVIDKLAALKRISNLDMKIITTGAKEISSRRYSSDFQTFSLYSIQMDNISRMTDVLKQLVKRRVSRLIETRPAWSDLDAIITTKLWDKTPNYNWAMFRVQELEKQLSDILSTRLAMFERLESFPSDKETFFVGTYDKIPALHRLWLKEAVRWISFSLRPLTSSELAVAVAFGEPENRTSVGKLKSFQALEPHILSDLAGDVNRIAGYLVKVDDGKVEVANPELLDLWVANFLHCGIGMHAELLKACLKYLCWVREQAGEEGIEFHARRAPACDLLDYSVLYWPFHFSKAAQEKQALPGILESALSFLSDLRNLSFWSRIVRYHRPIGFCHDFSTSPLKASAAFGLLPLVESLIGNIDASGPKDSGILVRESMNLAIEQEHTDVGRVLFQKLQELGESPSLCKVAEKGDLQLLQELLEISSIAQSINDKDSFGYSPLLYLAQRGSRDGVALLLQYNATVDAVTNDKSTALHIACQLGYTEVASTLLEHQANPNHRNRHDYSCLHLASRGGFEDLVSILLPHCPIEDRTYKGETPLHLAAMYGHASTCSHLIICGAISDTMDDDKQTPLALAVRGGFLETVKVLLQPELKASHQASKEDLDMNWESPLSKDNPIPEGTGTSPKDGLSLSPLQVTAENCFVDILEELLRHYRGVEGFHDDCRQAISRASIAGHWKAVKALLKHIETRNPVDRNRSSALHLAAKHGHVRLVNKLLQAGKYDPDLFDGSGFTALHLAAQFGQAKVVEAFINSGMSVDLETSDHDKAIHLAARRGHLDVVKAIQKCKDMRRDLDHQEQTPVQIAADSDHAPIVAELLSNDIADGEKVVDWNLSNDIWREEFPLHKFIREKNQSIAQVLIEKGYQVDFPDSEGNTPLHIAVTWDLACMVKFLVGKKADPKTRNGKDETPLFLAVKLCKIEACSAILETSSSQSSSFIDLPDKNEITPLYSACSQGNVELVRLLLDHKADLDIRCFGGWTALHAAAENESAAVLEILLNHGANTEIKNNYQSTAIIIAAEAGSTDSLNLLLNWKASAKVINKTGSSALHRAAQNGYLECVQALVGAGANVNLQKKNGQTPLHQAVLNSHVEVVSYLLQKEAKVNLRSDTGRTPLELAMLFMYYELAKILINKGATIKVDNTNLSKWTSEDTLLFALEHQSPPGFVFESLALALQHAISSRFDKVVSRLLETGVNVNETGGVYCTALQAAAANESIKFMIDLLKKGADPNILGGQYGSALTAAIVRDNLEAVAILLKHEANPNIIPKDDSDGAPSNADAGSESSGAYIDYPIHLAIKRASMVVVEMLLQAEANLDVRDRNGRTLLSNALQNGSKPTLDLLLSTEGIGITTQDASGQTPLMTAVIFGNSDALKKLLAKGADPNTPDAEQMTPFIRAVMGNRTDHGIVRTLLMNGADPFMSDCRGRGALYWACLLGKRSLIEEIILPALELDEIHAPIPQLPFHAVASSNAMTPGEQMALWELLDSAKIVENSATVDENGWTVEYTAKRYGFSDLVELVTSRYPKIGRYPIPGPLIKPSAWHQQDKALCLEVSNDGKTVTVGRDSFNLSSLSQSRAVIRANHPMPGDDLFYFEVRIEEDAYENIIGVGFCTEDAPLTRMLGWDPNSWGYHGDDGKAFSPDAMTRGYHFGESYKKGDIIGCGVNFDKKIAFFTKYGKLLGPAFKGIKGRLYPAVCFAADRPGARVSVNFGSEKFQYKDWRLEKNTEGSLPEVASESGSDEDSESW